MNGQSPCFSGPVPSNRVVWLPNVDGHPDRFLPILHELGWPIERWRRHPDAVVCDQLECIATWRYTLDEHGGLADVAHATTPGRWSPYPMPAHRYRP